MPSQVIRIGDDCISILDAWKYEHESYSDAIRRMDRNLKKAGAVKED